MKFSALFFWLTSFPHSGGFAWTNETLNQVQGDRNHFLNSVLMNYPEKELQGTLDEEMKKLIPAMLYIIVGKSMVRRKNV